MCGWNSSTAMAHSTVSILSARRNFSSRAYSFSFKSAAERKASIFMKHVRAFVVSSVVGGLLIVVPLYLSVLLILKAMQAVAGIVRPLAKLLPEWIPAERVLSLLLVLIVCFLIGAAV